MRVLALDPGERVGWAAGEIGEHRQLVTPVRSLRGYVSDGKLPKPTDVIKTKPLPVLEVTDHGMAYLKTMALSVYKALVEERKYDVVVMEDFKLSARGAKVSIGSDMQTSQFIGMVRLACWLSNTKLVMQPPAAMSTARKTFGNHPSGADVAERVAKCDSVAHDDGHDGSALLHLWAYFRERYV